MEDFAECIFQWFSAAAGHHWGAVVPPDQRIAFHPQLKVDPAHVKGRDDDRCWWEGFDININLIGFVLPQIVFSSSFNKFSNSTHRTFRSTTFDNF